MEKWKNPFFSGVKARLIKVFNCPIDVFSASVISSRRAMCVTQGLTEHLFPRKLDVVGMSLTVRGLFESKVEGYFVAFELVIIFSLLHRMWGRKDGNHMDFGREVLEEELNLRATVENAAMCVWVWVLVLNSGCFM